MMQDKIKMMNSTDQEMAPGFLVASPAVAKGPDFTNTVVALGVHEQNGALGFIINRPTDISLHSIVQDLGLEPRVPDRPVLFGGPASYNTGFVLYEHPKNCPIAPGFSLSDTVSVSPSRALLQEAIAGKLPGHFELLLGYVTWESGQLETEMERGGWLSTTFSPGVIFDTPACNRWSHAVHCLGISPLAFVRVRGGAQA